MGSGFAVEGAVAGVDVGIGATYDFVSAEYSPAGLNVTQVGELYAQLQLFLSLIHISEPTRP